MDYRNAYDSIMEIQSKLQEELGAAAAQGNHAWAATDYRKVKALAATFELQDYIANEMAKRESTGD